MEITRDDFNEEYWQRFTVENQDMILSFCNTFINRFPELLSKEEIIDRMSSLNSIEASNLGSDYGRHSLSGDIEINSKVNFTENEKKEATYHEMMHHLSVHYTKIASGREMITEGLGPIGFNEIITQYLTTELVKAEGINLKSKYYIEKEEFSTTEEFMELEGIGYPRIAPLGKLYMEIFGQDIIEPYFKNASKFWDSFNEKFAVFGTIYELPFNSVDMDIGGATSKSSGTEAIYTNYSNALEIFKILEQDKFKGQIDAYEYLKDSKKIKDLLPKKVDVSKGIHSSHSYTGISDTIAEKLSELDEKFVLQYLRPDLVGEQTEPDKIEEKKKMFIVINGLRDNISKLEREDFQNIVFSENEGISTNEYRIDANGVKISAFEREGSYLGASKAMSKERYVFNSEFLKGLNGDLLNGTAITPNGDTISTYEYVTKYVEPILNENGTFKLKNGVEISARHYIEEYVLGEGQTKYNGDLDALMQDTLAGTDEPPQRDGWNQPTHGKVMETPVEQEIHTNNNTKIELSSFKKSLEKTRDREKIGLNEVKGEQDKVALRQERGKLVSLSIRGHLDEDGQRRLQELNNILNINNFMQQHSDRGTKKGQYTGQSR